MTRRSLSTHSMSLLKTALRHVRPRLLRRRFLAFGIAAPKSGGHSLFGMLGGACRAAHRPTAAQLQEWMLDLAAGRLERAELQRRLLQRDRDLWLELETTSLFDPFLEALVVAFPSARFVLPVREPRAWLRSYIDHQLGVPSSKMDRIRPLRFGAVDAERPEVEASLAKLKLYPIDGYLRFWADYHRRALSIVPAERLLVLRTTELGSRSAEIARFLGLDPQRVDVSRQHEFRTQKHFDVLDALPKDYLDSRIRALAGDVADRHFPELR